MTPTPPRRPLGARLWTYQAERFPLLAHGPLVALMAASAVATSAGLRGADAWPEALRVLAAVLVTVGHFILLRIADEHKDLDTDRLHRPERPVPRGLVSLKELRGVGAAVMTLQGLACVWAGTWPWLLAVWGYGALMTVEFFVPRLHARSIGLTLVTHGVIVPLVVLNAAAFDFAVEEWTAVPEAFWAFAIASLFGGNVIEIGRKLRVPADEQPGVETYSAAWGLPGATRAWVVAVGLSFVFAVVTLEAAGWASWSPRLGVVGLVLLPAFAVLLRPKPGRGRWIEAASAVWIVALYLILGTLPLSFG